MNTLTEEQAKLLRELRPGIRPLAQGFEKLHNAMSRTKCHPHEINEECPICDLEQKSLDLFRLCEAFGIDVDDYLLRGPHPRATTTCP